MSNERCVMGNERVTRPLPWGSLDPWHKDHLTFAQSCLTCLTCPTRPTRPSNRLIAKREASTFVQGKSLKVDHCSSIGASDRAYARCIGSWDV